MIYIFIVALEFVLAFTGVAQGICSLLTVF